MDGIPKTGLPPEKCCDFDFSLTDNFLCMRTYDENAYEIHDHSSRNFRHMVHKCPDEDWDISYSADLENVTLNICNDFLVNGTLVFTNCREPENKTHEAVTTIKMWATEHELPYMTTNVAHIILCMIIVSVYHLVPELRRTVYNRAILRHYISLLCRGLSVCALNYFYMFKRTINEKFLTCVWLVLQYFTLSTVFWLNVICYDMTLVITRLEWVKDKYDDKKKLQIYGIFAMGVAVLPVLFAAFFEFAPMIPEDFVLKPNYVEYSDQRRWIVYCYLFLLPSLTLFCNNALFIYTTYKMIKINQSTEVATQSQTQTLRKKYLVFMKMYFFMGAPWFFVYAYAFFDDKVPILNYVWLIQPVLWSIVLLLNKKVRNSIVQKTCFLKKIEA